MSMSNGARAGRGYAAIKAGTPDFASEDLQTSATDAIANILHCVDRFGGNAAKVLEDAQMHFDAETN